jgi:ribosomal protein RSM22 (predicted rRNA methylase)
MGTAIKDKVSLVTCANVFNEIVEDATMPPDYLAKKYCEKILSYVPTAIPPSNTTHVLVIEPGVPKSARFISLLRDALDRSGFSPDAPCTHCGTCPMDGRRGGKWCNFAFSTDDAPNALKKLSEQSQLPKERAVLSFIMATRKQCSQIETVTGEVASSDTNTSSTAGTLSFRITSDPIRLPGERTGFYACSKKGLLLVVSDHHLFSGESFKIKTPENMDHIDAKSGAIVIDL